MQILYKYVTAERALTCLPEVGDGTLRVTQPSALNDPFECSISKAFAEDAEEIANKKLAEVLSSINENSPIGEEEVKRARSKYGSLYLRELFSKQISQRFGVISLSREALHPLLWAHYTKDGSGFVIGYTVELVEQSGNSSGRKKVEVSQRRAQEVNYAQKPGVLIGYEVLLDEENIYRILLSKSSYWEYEREWRIVLELRYTIGTGIKDDRGQPINLVRIPNGAVKEVYYTERTPQDKIKEIKKRLENPNNRFGTTELIKLELAEERYGYQVAHED